MKTSTLNKQAKKASISLFSERALMTILPNVIMTY